MTRLVRPYSRKLDPTSHFYRLFDMSLHPGIWVVYKSHVKAQNDGALIQPWPLIELNWFWTKWKKEGMWLTKLSSLVHTLAYVWLSKFNIRSSYLNPLHHPGSFNIRMKENMTLYISRFQFSHTHMAGRPKNVSYDQHKELSWPSLVFT